MIITTPISLPTPIGKISLQIEDVFSFSPDERGGVVIVLNEMIADKRLEIVSGYPYKLFHDWFSAGQKH